MVGMLWSRSGSGGDSARLLVLLALDLLEALERAVGLVLVAGAAVEARERVLRLRVGGVQPGRFLELGDRLGGAAPLLERDAELVAGRREAGVGGERLPEEHLGLVEPVETSEEEAEVEGRPRRLRLLLAVQPYRLLPAPPG